MSFISITFLAFLCLTFLAYFIIPLNFRWMVLLVASLIFYCSNGWTNLLYVLTTAVVAYAVTRKMESIYAVQVDRSEVAQQRKQAKRYVVFGIVAVALILVYFKIGNRVIDAVQSIWALESLDISILMPLGISYYTFSIISYMADVYWKKDEVEHNFFKLLLYMIFFPHILQGPIARHKKLASQLVEGHTFEYTRFCYGLQRIVWGYFKKMVIADRFVIIVNTVFGNYTEYTGLVFIVATLAAAIHLYCDFSGCMDIGLGISECMGIKLEENFQRPFFAKSAAEFWRRWHITLGAFYKDYIYMPLVISPKLIKLSQFGREKFSKRFGKSIMTIVPLVCVWAFTGFWHGTGLNYILWGCYWGGIIMFSNVFAPEIKKLTDKLHIDTSAPWWGWWQMVRTFLIFCGSRLLTAPGDITVTWEVMKRIFAEFNIWILFDGTLWNLGLDYPDFCVGILAVALLWWVSLQQEKGIVMRDKVAALPIVLRWAVYYAGIFAILIFGMYGPGYEASSFVYMNY